VLSEIIYGWFQRFFCAESADAVATFTRKKRFG
jgi:hypothetical protein